MTKPSIDQAPKSDFVREMEAAIVRRLNAVGKSGKAAVDREIAGIVKAYLGRDAWQAMVDAERETPDVPRGTRRDRFCHARRTRGAGGARYSDSFDHKLAQSGEREED